MESGKRKREKGKGEKSETILSPFSILPSPGSGFPSFHSTFDMIQALERGEFPERAMLTFHPQRWTDHPVLWVRELVEQNVKNGVKMVIVRGRERGVKRRK